MWEDTKRAVPHLPPPFTVLYNDDVQIGLGRTLGDFLPTCALFLFLSLCWWHRQERERAVVERDRAEELAKRLSKSLKSRASFGSTAGSDDALQGVEMSGASKPPTLAGETAHGTNRQVELGNGDDIEVRIVSLQAISSTGGRGGRPGVRGKVAIHGASHGFVCWQGTTKFSEKRVTWCQNCYAAKRF